MRRVGTCLLAAATIVAALSAAWAEGTPLSATGAWVRWLPEGLPAAGYLTLRNDSATPQRLTNASSPDYRTVMLHRTVRKNGIDQMIEPGGIDIPPGASVSLTPGAFHLMLMDARHGIAPGQSVTFHVVFASGVSLDVQAIVKPANAADAEIK